jgi:hypothetical protein
MNDVDTAKVYNKREWSDKPKTVSKRLWYHSLSPEQKEQHLAYQRQQRHKRAEKRALKPVRTERERQAHREYMRNMRNFMKQRSTIPTQ